MTRPRSMSPLYPEVYALLRHSRRCEANIAEFLTAWGMPHRSMQRGMHLTVYYARRPLPGHRAPTRPPHLRHAHARRGVRRKRHRAVRVRTSRSAVAPPPASGATLQPHLGGDRTGRLTPRDATPYVKSTGYECSIQGPLAKHRHRQRRQLRLLTAVGAPRECELRA